MPQTRVEIGNLKLLSHFEARLRKSISFNQRLDKLEEHGVCIILAKAVDKLKIVEKLLPELEVVGFEPYQAISTRMTTLQKTKPPEHQDVASSEYLKHIQHCRFMCQEVLEKMIRAFNSGESMLPDLKYTTFLENLRYYDNFLLKQENINLKNNICTLNEKISFIKKQSEETRLYMNKLTQICLHQAAMRAWAQCKTLKRNNDVHQQAKVDHNANRIKEKEDSLADLREQCTTAMLRENTVNNEVTSHLETAIGNLQKKIEKWTARYSEEVDSLDIALLLLKSKIEDQHEKFNKMTEQYSAKLELLESLHTEADDRDRELEIRIARSKAAVIIQHWWRGVLAKGGAEKSGKNRKKSKKSSTKRKKRKQSPKRKNK